MSRENQTEDEPPFAFEDVWPDDKPFPLSDAECARLVRGYLVRWRGTLEEALGKPIRVAESIRDAVVGADVVVEATRLAAPEPLLETAWLDACTLLVPYGTMSVLELDVLERMDKVVVDDWAQCKRDDPFGALRPHVRAGLLTDETVYGELADFVAGSKPGRESDSERILFWHRGLATTDIALGQAILDRAIEQDVGTMLPYR